MHCMLLVFLGFPISEKSSDVVSLVIREKFEKQPNVMDVKFDIVTEKFFEFAQTNVECEVLKIVFSLKLEKLLAC